MEQARFSDRANGLPSFEAALWHQQFSVIDAFRRMQGDVLASFGFGPIESSYRVIASGPYWRLRDYDTVHRSRPVLIVAAPIKRPYIWDLAPSVSAIRCCLKAGLRVHLLEWLPASDKTCNVGITECAETVAASLAVIGSGPQGPKPTLMGHSLGGTLAAIYAATAPATIGGLVLLGSPLCFRPGESPFRDALVSLVPEPVSDSEPYPGSILSHASAAASPDTFVWSRLTDSILSLADGRAADIHARVERWALDEVALHGKLVREIVELLYRENRFCRGILKVGEQIIGPENLAAPTLAVVNTADVVAPLHSVSPISEALGPEKFHIIEYPGETGVCLQHLGILVGRHAHAQIWPQIIDWIMPQYEQGLKLRA
jgi:polyhydroxyalkanoate synthase